MCYINGVRVTKAEYLEFMAIRKELKNLQLNRAAQSGFLYQDWPIIKPAAEGWEIKFAHWEYIPSFVRDEEHLKEQRKFYTWLNATSENLLVNEKGKASIYKEGALHGRCLVLSTGFFEHRHLQVMGKKGKLLKTPEKFPYFITLKDADQPFFIAGVSRQWNNMDTFAIVTTQANELMQVVHNSKRRMPTILPAELAEEWICPGLSEKRILEIASYQFPADKMVAWPVDKKFIEKEDPTTQFEYENLPALSWN
jgi:putative SOS response-associated peptidase YedK